jgi:tetratricopeptide (TPR) repeat protein
MEGKLDEALLAYTEGKAIRERLVGLDPANSLWQRDLSASLSRISGVYTAMGDFPRAYQALKEALEIIIRLARADPSNADWQHDLMLTHIEMADLIARELTHLHDPAEHLECALDIARRLMYANRLSQVHINIVGILESRLACTAA